MDTPTGESGQATEVAKRSAEGKFLPGVSGNPKGRPKALLIDHQRTLEAVVRDHLTSEKVKRILNKLVEMASNGDVKAAKLILDKLIPNAIDSDEAPDTGRTVVFRIENATFGAAQAVPKNQSAIIDVTVEDPQEPNGQATD